MLHYTFNTADTFDCSFKKYSQEALSLLNPIAKHALIDGQTTANLPKPFENYSLKITTTVGAAMFDVFGTDKGILTTNAVAWTDSGAEESWEVFETLYVLLSQQYGIILGRAPKQPKSLPWLSTLITPNPEILILSWLADFEQCFAVALIRESNYKPKPKGFG